MNFEAHYAKARLAFLAFLGLAFAALGGWMATRSAEDMLDGSSRKIAALADIFGAEPVTVAHVIGWMAIVIGLGVLPIVFSNLRHNGPAMRIDESGIYWHRWSEQVIPWSNIDALKPYTIQGQKMVGITLVDPNLNAKQGLMGKLKGVNNALGFGHLALTLQGTDGDYASMVETLMYFASTKH